MFSGCCFLTAFILRFPVLDFSAYRIVIQTFQIAALSWHCLGLSCWQFTGYSPWSLLELAPKKDKLTGWATKWQAGVFSRQGPFCSLRVSLTSNQLQPELRWISVHQAEVAVGTHALTTYNIWRKWSLLTNGGLFCSLTCSSVDLISIGKTLMFLAPCLVLWKYSLLWYWTLGLIYFWKWKRLYLYNTAHETWFDKGPCTVMSVFCSVSVDHTGDLWIRRTIYRVIDIVSVARTRGEFRYENRSLVLANPLTSMLQAFLWFRGQNPIPHKH